MILPIGVKLAAHHGRVIQTEWREEFACGSDSSTAVDGGAEASVDASRGLQGGGLDGAAPDAAAEAASCASASSYVAPTGSGTACSSAAPRALETGRDQARALAGAATSDVVVLLEGGAYRLTETFASTAADSGMGGHAIVYHAAPGATPVPSGAISVSGFTANLWVQTATARISNVHILPTPPL